MKENEHVKPDESYWADLFANEPVSESVNQTETGNSQTDSVKPDVSDENDFYKWIADGKKLALKLFDASKNKSKEIKDNLVNEYKVLKEKADFKQNFELNYPGLRIIKIETDYFKYKIDGLDKFVFLSTDGETIQSAIYHDYKNVDKSYVSKDKTQYLQNKYFSEVSTEILFTVDMEVNDFEGIKTYLKNNFDTTNFK